MQSYYSPFAIKVNEQCHINWQPRELSINACGKTGTILSNFLHAPHQLTTKTAFLILFLSVVFFVPYLLVTFVRKRKELKFCICILRACHCASNFLNKRTIAIAMSSTLNLIHPNTHTFVWLIFFFFGSNFLMPARLGVHSTFYFHSLTSSLILLDCKNLNVDCLNCR